MGHSRLGKKSVVALSILLSVVLFQGCFQSITSSGASRAKVGAPEDDANTAFSTGIAPRPVAIDRSFRSLEPLVRAYSDRYDLDWILVAAVMSQESRFDHQAVSSRGAYGLMQLMPTTQIELTEKLGLDEAMTPANNVRAGVFHLRSLTRSFEDAQGEEGIRLALAAYNAGLGRIQDAQRVAKYLGNDPNTWVAVRDALPYLSKKYYTLHASIWPEGRPSSGYMKNPRETIRYVDRVMERYDEYALAMK